ncbi:AGAP012384-PA-like protein [Anopheles sinensis]|uniref:AGAP012384-PA-like protein n=1 Tax=Anopheles sinensis TaxID=74873 RepID=A0A084VS26_ANOSI|nr:AGAP012384-PA-like protein [Anopheles sinensis]
MGNYSFLSNRTEELIFINASLDALDLSGAMRKITPWKVSISGSNVSRLVFPSQMTTSVVHLRDMAIEELIFNENTGLQDFRADYTSLQTVPPTIAKLLSLDILWITHSELTFFNFDKLQNSSISLLYLVGNKIEDISITPGLVCCENLEEVFLSGNRLKQLDFGVLALMVKLKTIFLEENQLVSLNMSVELTRNSSNTNVAGDSNETTTGYCSWRSYYLEQEGSQLPGDDGPTPNCTDYFASLLSIHLARNKIEQVDFMNFSFMNSLNSLDMSNNMLVNLSSNVNEVPIRLSELFVSNNNISFVYLTPLSNLKALYLYDNTISALNMSSLPKDIDYLNLINNPLDCNVLPHMNKTTNFPTLGPYTEC